MLKRLRPKISNDSVALNNLIFYPLEDVSRFCAPQLKVDENYSHIVQVESKYMSIYRI